MTLQQDHGAPAPTPAATSPQQGETAQVTVRYFAGARRAAAVEQDTVAAVCGSTVSTVLEEITARRGDELAKVLPACSFLLDGVAVRDLTVSIALGAELDVLPPFAGG